MHKFYRTKNVTGIRAARRSIPRRQEPGTDKGSRIEQVIALKEEYLGSDACCLSGGVTDPPFP